MAPTRGVYTSKDVRDLLADVEEDARSTPRPPLVTSKEQWPPSAKTAPHRPEAPSARQRPLVSLPGMLGRPSLRQPVVDSKEQCLPRIAADSSSLASANSVQARLRLPKESDEPVIIPAVQHEKNNILFRGADVIFGKPSIPYSSHAKQPDFIGNMHQILRFDKPSFHDPLNPMDAAPKYDLQQKGEHHAQVQSDEQSDCRGSKDLHSGKKDDAMKVDCHQRQGSGAHESAAASRRTPGKRLRAEDLWYADDMEDQRHAERRARGDAPLLSHPLRSDPMGSEPLAMSHRFDGCGGGQSGLSQIGSARPEEQTYSIADAKASTRNPEQHEEGMEPPRQKRVRGRGKRQRRLLEVVLEKERQKRKLNEVNHVEPRDMNGSLALPGIQDHSPTGLLNSSMYETSKRRRLDPTNHTTKFPKFSDLPDDIQDKILITLLEMRDPISFDTNELEVLTRRSVEVPEAIARNKASNKKTYILKGLDVLQSELKQMGLSTAFLPCQDWLCRPSTKDLTLSLLRVNKTLSFRAVRIFYANNTFSFLNRSNAWLHLEAFLLTIGAINARHIQHLRLPVPTWHLGAGFDAVAGAILDAVSPATRLVKFAHPVPDDRLLSAFSTCSRLLAAGGNVKSFRVELVWGEVQAFVDVASDDDADCVLSAYDKMRRAERKASGEQMWRRFSQAMGPGSEPCVVVYTDKKDPLRAERFMRWFGTIASEADKFGWRVDRELRER